MREMTGIRIVINNKDLNRFLKVKEEADKKKLKKLLKKIHNVNTKFLLQDK